MKALWNMVEVVSTDAIYCDACGVIEVAAGDKYCSKCVDELVEYLAKRFDEQVAVDGGLY